MTRLSSSRRSRRSAIVRTAALGAVLSLALTGIAIAAGSTLSAVSGTVGKTHETIVVNASGRAVYTLTGDSKTHSECASSNGCWSIWPPVTVGKGQRPSKGAGVSGTLSVWTHSGINQVLQNGHPLYTFSGDGAAHVANGNGLKTFGGTWFVVR
jgi:predicted lipoprotein with Yx(FWY)xxD motif